MSTQRKLFSIIKKVAEAHGSPLSKPISSAHGLHNRETKESWPSQKITSWPLSIKMNALGLEQRDREDKFDRFFDSAALRFNISPSLFAGSIIT